MLVLTSSIRSVVVYGVSEGLLPAPDFILYNFQVPNDACRDDQRNQANNQDQSYQNRASHDALAEGTASWRILPLLAMFKLLALITTPLEALASDHRGFFGFRIEPSLKSCRCQRIHS